MGIFGKLKAGLALSRAANQFERDNKMGNYEWAKGLRAGVTQILTLILTAIITAVLGVLSDSEAIRAVLLNAGVNEAYVGVFLLLLAGVVRFAQNYRKHNPPNPTTTNAGQLILLALLPTFAQAQEPAKDVPEYSIRTGSVTTATRGETDTRFSARLSLSIWTDKPGEHQQRDGIFPRVTLTGSQDGGSLALQNPEEFRSIVPEIEFRKTIRGALQAAGFGSLTFSAEGDVDKPINARMFEGCGGLRGSLQDDSSLFVGGCFSGPVGGTLALGVRGAKPVGGGEAWFSFVLPLRETALREKAWVLQAGTTYVVARGNLK